jgi:hypothetical protein
MLKPTFAFTIGALSSASDNAVAGPRRICITRAMDVPADGGEIALASRAGVGLGDAVSVELGHDGENEVVLAGTVAALRPGFLGVQVTVLGVMQKLLDLRVAAWYANQSAGAIARDLLDRAGLEAGAVDDGPTLPHFAVDGRQSAYAYLRRLADRLGYELYARRDGKLCFHGLGAGAGLDAGGLLGAASGAVGDAAGAVAGALLGAGAGYQYGQHLLAGQAQQQPPAWGRIVVGGESPMSGEGDSTAHWLTANDSDYQGEAGSGSSTLLLLDPVARTKDIAGRFAAGQLVTAARRTHQITIRVLGSPQLDLGDTIDIGAAPDDLLNGSGYIRALHHQFDDELGFVTDLRVALAAA